MKVLELVMENRRMVEVFWGSVLNLNDAGKTNVIVYVCIFEL